MPLHIAPNKRLKIVIRGAVQGVGFRPFVHRLATQESLGGWVVNTAQGVVIEVEGKRLALERFFQRLHLECPPHSVLLSVEPTWLDTVGLGRFEIRVSETVGPVSTVVMPDLATCPECVAEIFDSSNRRYLYPFTNCTHCGPRYSIMAGLPYDRPNTAMAKFRLCAQCHIEYNNPRDRRFHAQPNACPRCGPQLVLWEKRGRPLAKAHDALIRAATAITEGQIVAVKGLGGFQLMVSARSEKAVARLRQLKQRDEKPFAVMFPTIELVEAFCEVTPAEAHLLLSAEAPIVLLPRRVMHGRALREGLALSIAPNNPLLGAMLPHTPLHHILLNHLGIPVVATSGNLRDEPLCIDELDALKRLGPFVDFLLVHNRPILHHVDDSVVRMVSGRELVLRRARGYAPLPVGLLPVSKWHATPDDAPPALAVGAHLKNAIALATGGQIFLSQHIGDLETELAARAMERVAGDLQKLYHVRPAAIVADLHPDYVSSQWALRQATEILAAAPAEAPVTATPAPTVSAPPALKLEAADALRPWARRPVERNPLPPGAAPKLYRVQHHLAHVLACLAENEVEPPVLGVAWDGAGLGTDGTVWGGEFLKVTDGAWERVAHLRTFRLPGGDAAAREPRRSALGLLFEMRGEAAFDLTGTPIQEAFSAEELANLRTMLERGLNAPVTSSAGRLFDAAAALVLRRRTSAFEGQAAMELELMATTGWDEKRYAFPLKLPDPATGGPAVLDWGPLIQDLLEDLKARASSAMASTRFHDALVRGILAVAQHVGIERVALSGGCFQNRILTERTAARLTEKGFKPCWHQRIPPNDGGLAVGQILALRKGFAVPAA
jgi:hydrogenase maturation protein HypF